MAKNNLKDFEMLNLKELARAAGIPYPKLRNCIAGTYNSLTDQEKTQLYNTIRDGVEKSTLWLGYSFDGRKLTKA